MVCGSLSVGVARQAGFLRVAYCGSRLSRACPVAGSKGTDS